MTVIELNKIIGAEIKKARTDAKLTQQELAEKIGYSSKQAISAIESGRESVAVSTLASICQTLNMEALFFLRKK